MPRSGVRGRGASPATVTAFLSIRSSPPPESAASTDGASQEAGHDRRRAAEPGAKDLLRPIGPLMVEAVTGRFLGRRSEPGLPRVQWGLRLGSVGTPLVPVPEPLM